VRLSNVFEGAALMQNPQPHKTIILWFLLLFALLLVGCSQAQASEEVIEQKWLASAHADAESRAFTRWNDQEPAQIPSACAKCHSTEGYLSFLGTDGSTPGKVSQAMPVGSTIECEVCHNEVAKEKDSAIMPSGVELTGLGKSANCLECHQGRTHTGNVNDVTGSGDPDTVKADMSLPNIHNNAAGPTQYGTQATGGYEYEGKAYLGHYTHAPEFVDCIACHDPHTLAVPVEKCRACHVEATSTEALQNIRVHKRDFDGDGDVSEGIAGEIETMRDRLLLAIRIYARVTEGLDDIVYEDRPPYFLDEQGEAYSTWTPRLLRAAYNHQYASTGVGGYAHNGLYTLQLLYDSLNDLGANMSAMTRPEAK
jgi:hypothetical protein